MRRLIGVLPCLTVLLLAACGGVPATVNSSAGTAPQTITIGVSAGSTNIAFAPHWATVHGGALDDVGARFGTKFAQQSFASGPPLIAAVAAGQIPLAILPTNTLIALAAKGRPLVGILHLTSGGAGILVGAARYRSSRGTDISAYNGSTWGYTGEGATTQLVAKIAAATVGLDWGAQNRLALGPVSALEPALRAGRADIAAMDPDSAAETIADGVGYVVLNSNEDNKAYPYGAAGTSLVATRSFLAKYPDLATAIVGAELRGLLGLQKSAADAEAARGLLPPEATTGAWKEKWSLVAPALTGTTGMFTTQCIDQSIALARTSTGDNVLEHTARSALVNDYVTRGYQQLQLPVPAGN